MPLFDLRQEASPLVVSVPHDGALIPDDILSSMNPKVVDSTDRDLLINEVFEFDGLAYSKIKANYSRHVIDLNRPATGEALYQNQAETELCPTTTFGFKEIYQIGKKPDQAEIQRRIDKYWQPYHDQLQNLINQANADFGYCIVIDAHSIDDEVPRFFDGKLPDINVGTNGGKSCNSMVEQVMMNQLSIQNQFTYINNGRFKGGHITRYYGMPTENIHAVQLEHAKSCYLNGGLNISDNGIKLRLFWKNSLLAVLKKIK